MQNFSVCMAVYFGDKPIGLKLAVESIYQHQTLMPNEIVLVVDGPVHDEMNHIIAHLQKSIECLKVIRFKENLGHAAARRAGVAAAKNATIALMDADDISLPDRFEKQISYMAAHPEVAVVGGQIAEFINDDSNF